MKYEKTRVVKSAVVLPFLTGFAFSQKKHLQKKMKIIKPKRLSKGDAVALITPASGVEVDVFERALLNISDLGFRVKIGKNARLKNGFLAGKRP